MRKYSISPVINGLSDHDAQLITIHTHNLRSYAKKYMLIRQINYHTINDFLTKLSCELWDGVFSTTAVNKMFNSFLDTYLKIFYSSFPLKRAHINKKQKNWITVGIQTSCKHKREIYIACKNSNNQDLLKYYKKYSKVLCAVINEAKKTKLCK